MGVTGKVECDEVKNLWRGEENCLKGVEGKGGGCGGMCKGGLVWCAGSALGCGQLCGGEG